MARRRNMFRPRRPLGSFLLTTTTFIAFAAIIWHAYQDNVSQNRAEASIPLIRASAEPLKAKPTHESGMEVPHRDMLVFDQIEEPFAGRERDITKVRFADDEVDEAVLPPLTGLTKIDENFDIKKANQEETRKQVAALLSYEKNDALASAAADEASNTVSAIEAPAVQELSEDFVEAINEEVTPEEATPVVSAPVQKNDEPKPQTVLIMKSQEAKPQDVMPQAVIKPTVSGDYIIQLGSVRSEQGAKEEWQKISNRLPGVLSTLSLNVERADLGAKGVFYRIQGGKVSKEEADNLCAKLKSAGTDCMVRKIQ